MTKQYHVIGITLIGLVIVGLTVSTSPQTWSSGHGGTLGGSLAFAEDDHHYGSDGYDEEGRDHQGRDRDGYDREGYSRDGYRRDRTYHKDRDQRKKDRSTTSTSGSAQSFEVKPKVNQY